MSYLYTIIIPQKDCVLLTRRCLLSIPERDDIQVIVVDDNSEKIEEIKKLQKEFLRPNYYFLFTNENRGAGYARNIGLSHAMGEWVIFADADDYFVSDAFLRFDSFVDSNTDIVYFTHRSVYSDTLEPCERYSVRNNLILKFDKLNNKKNENNLKYLDVVPWAKMFRRAVVAGNLIKFDEVPASNDVMFVVNVAFRSENIAVSKYPCYVLTFRKGSITRVVNKTNNFSRFQVSLRYNRFLKDNNISVPKIRIISHVLRAFRLFGYREAVRYLKVIRDNRQSVFEGFIMSWDELKERFSRFFNKDSYRG